MSEELKPCPFCGSRALDYRELTHFGERGQKVGKLVCRSCGCKSITAMRAEAIAAWNRRAEPPPSPASEVDRAAVVEQCARVAHDHREKGPWHGTELTVWRRACSQVEDAILALSPPRETGE